MGNESSCSIKDFNISQHQIVEEENGLKYHISSATYLKNKYTIFQYFKQKGAINESIEKHIELIRTTRHPYILKYIKTFDDYKSKSLVTEHVTPLDVAIETQENDEVYTGLFNILEALVFLHERSLVCHNRLTVSSVFVDKDGVWKLSAFENSTKAQRLSKQSYEKDMKGYAEFALSVLEYLKDDDSKTKEFMSKIEMDFLNDSKDISNMTLKPLLKDPFFDFSFLEILEDIKTLAFKDLFSKRRFFECLKDKLSSLHPQVISRRLISPLFSHMLLTEPEGSVFHKHLFASDNDYCINHKVESIYDQQYFKKYSLPLILSLFESKDIVIRLMLLKYIELYVDQIHRSVLKDKVLPEILLGLKDENESIVVETFKCLALLVPLLGAADVVGGRLSSIFLDQKPDFSRSPKGIAKDDRFSNNHQNTSSDRLTEKTMTESIIKSQDEKLNKERKRLEREKQRELQRQIREKRRKEREDLKAKRLIGQLDDGNNESSENSAVSSIADPIFIENNDKTDIILYDEVVLKRDSVTSEPDWEGFEAFSNSSDSEQRQESYIDHYVSNTIPEDAYTNVNLLEKTDKLILKEVDHGESWDDWDQQEDIPNSNKVELFDEKEEQKMCNQKDIAETIINADEEKLEFTIPLDDTKLPEVSKSMSLSDTKKIKSSDSPEEKRSKQNESCNTKKSKELGNEFEISDIKVKEPDYFADMMPTLEKQKLVAHLETNSSYSTKFNAVDLLNEEPAGWDEDDNDGWNTEDF